MVSGVSGLISTSLGIRKEMIVSWDLTALIMKHGRLFFSENDGEDYAMNRSIHNNLVFL